MAWVPQVHASLLASFTDWIYSRRLWRDLADYLVPMRLLAAGDDVRPSWPLEELAALVPDASFETVPGAPHDLRSTHPGVWSEVVSRAYTEVLGPGAGR